MIHLGKALAATKKGTFERALAVGRALERWQILRDGSLADTFQGVKPKKKHKKCPTKDASMKNLVEKYLQGDLDRAAYAEE